MVIYLWYFLVVAILDGVLKELLKSFWSEYWKSYTSKEFLIWRYQVNRTIWSKLQNRRISMTLLTQGTRCNIDDVNALRLVDTLFFDRMGGRAIDVHIEWSIQICTTTLAIPILPSQFCYHKLNIILLSHPRYQFVTYGMIKIIAYLIFVRKFLRSRKC